MIEKIKNNFGSIEEKNRNQEIEHFTKFNSISKSTNVLLNMLFITLVALCILPFLFVVIISLTSEQALKVNGYKLWPDEWSLEAYRYIFDAGSNIFRSYGITIFVTVTGTILGLIIMTTYAYALSRKNFAFRGFFTKLIFIPMLFSGGMVASYLVVTRFLGLKNNLLALILPICVSSFNIIIFHKRTTHIRFSVAKVLNPRKRMRMTTWSRCTGRASTLRFLKA